MQLIMEDDACAVLQVDVINMTQDLANAISRMLLYTLQPTVLCDGEFDPTIDKINMNKNIGYCRLRYQIVGRPAEVRIIFTIIMQKELYEKMKELKLVDDVNCYVYMDKSDRLSAIVLVQGNRLLDIAELSD